MSYSVLAFVAAAVAVVADLLVLRTRLLTRAIYWTTEAIVLAFQLAVNGVLTGRGVVRYDPRAIIGAHLVFAPIEDLFFGFALVTLTLSLWVWLGRRASARAG